MGATKRDFTEQREGDCYVNMEVTVAFYESNMDLFNESEDVKIKSSYRKRVIPKNDEVYKQKMETFIEASRDLMEYQIERGYKEYLK